VVISNRQHPLVREFREVARGDHTRALVDGWHLLHDAARAGMAIRTVAHDGGDRGRGAAALIDRLSTSARVVTVSPAVLGAMSPVQTPTGVVALLDRPAQSLAMLRSPQPSLVLVVVDVQDPGNVGAVIRAAEAGGATGVAVTGASADPWSWKALRAASGSTFRLPVWRGDDAIAVCSELREAGVRVLATTPREGVPMYEAALDRSVALLLGSEGAGLSHAVLMTADDRISIPMVGVESLNVAVAAGVIVYEARRQRAERRTKGEGRRTGTKNEERERSTPGEHAAAAPAGEEAP
jgi:TrmH family RNA methyltransferase